MNTTHSNYWQHPTTQASSVWLNRETERTANEVFSSRQTFFFIKQVMAEQPTFAEKIETLSDLMTQWVGDEWDEGEQLFAWDKVNWKAIVQEILRCKWEVSTV